MWIKICGMTTPEAIEAALAARVDAVGFVFAASPRQLTPREAARLAKPARGRVRCVAVTRHPAQVLLDEIIAELAPDVWQSDLEDFNALHAPSSLERLPVLRADAAEPRRLPPRALFEGATSGAGVACDWTAARAVARRTQIVLAGGLTALNVAAAIDAVRPFGVDVSSGVEERAGVKSAQRILQFAEAVRRAPQAQLEEKTP
ncbi:MAG TPA: phosphoribosylanthranilate isomerase [Steroidobacteraceae bacterium]|nr:phosphoribosylanthranilate isomerase [Steroidobacteraceae bacterium]